MEIPDLKVVYDEEAVRAALEGMVFDIMAKTENAQLVLVMILKGGVFTGFGMLRYFASYVPYGFIGLSSYKNETEAGGGVEVTYDLDFPDDFLADKDVWIVDDVIQRGITMSTAVNLVGARNPRSIHTAVLVSKESKTGDESRNSASRCP